MEEESILGGLVLLNKNNIISLYIEFYFKLIAPLEFENKIVNYLEISQLDSGNQQFELLSLNYDNLRDVDKSKEIILEIFGGTERFFEESIFYIAESLDAKKIDTLDASRILAEIADSERIDIPFEFVGFHSEFLRLGISSDYIERFNQLLQKTAIRLKENE